MKEGMEMKALKNMEALMRIYNNLLNGEQYGSVCYYREDFPSLEAGKPYFWYSIAYANPAPSNRYFHYRHYGSSAIKVNKRNLEWLIRAIFQCTETEFEQRYITKTEFERRYGNENLSH